MQHPAPVAILLLLPVLAIAISCNQPIKYPEGGYDYPAHYTPEDTAFYYYPLKRYLSRKDSFYRAAEFFLFKHLDEPNLSLLPREKDVFRLVYAAAYEVICITVAPNKIVVKKPSRDYFLYLDDEYSPVKNTLTPTEKYLLRQLERRYPIYPGKYSKQPFLEKKIDSLVKLYPQLMNPGYFWNLVAKKCATTKNLRFSETDITITKEDFNHIVSIINASGYWKMPWSLPCDPCCTDGDSYSLEANTSKKYNYVQYGSCNDTELRQKAFSKACQEIVKYAKLDKEISLVHNWKIAPALDSTKMDSAR